MGKHLRHSEVKHADKFAEVLHAVWEKVERYVVRVGLVVTAGVIVFGAWLLISHLFAGSSDQAWEDHFQLVRDLSAEAAKAPEDSDAVADRYLVKLREFVDTHRGDPAAAIALLELAQGHARRAAALREEKPTEARKQTEEAAGAAERFIADFPDHRDIAIARYEAGKARLELGEWERAADHFEKAAGSKIPLLDAMARLMAGYCYEQLGRLDQARLTYEKVRVDPLAGWCAEQADFALAQLGRRPAKPPQKDSAPPAQPAPSK